ncbi:helix-turn-helix domain-containing protein [Streptomyces viridochromogenes]|uniref:helix-turn-helix domain-containing protein n=1 Tax=Streptomyces viridochromogenes TaxID=1938 RepID=UPI0030B873FF
MDYVLHRRAERSRVADNRRLPKPVFPRIIGSPPRHQHVHTLLLPEATQNRKALPTGMPSHSSATQHGQFSPAHIRATWSGTASVEEAAQAFGLSRSKSYDLVRRGEFPCRVLRIGRATRVVTASLLRVLESGEPEYNAVDS